VRSPFTHTIPFTEALRRVLEAVVPIERTEVLGIGEADGRVAAEDVTARADVPPFDRAAMDGYAVRAQDTTGAVADDARALTCVGQALAGQVPARDLKPGECIEIATGAPLPRGADAVVMVERTRREGDLVQVFAAATAGQHLGRRGADLAAGQRAIAGGDVLSPARVGALAAVGRTHLSVFARPSVALLSTGNELAEPGAPLGPGQIYDVNRFTIDAVVRRHGGVASSLPTAADVISRLVAALLEATASHDIILSSGGSSVGERDLMLDALALTGEVVFHGIAVKPGKPTLFGRIGRTAVFGMPGNPTSCLSNAYMLLVPFLRATARLPPWTPRRLRLPLARRIVSTAGRHQFYTVRIENGQAMPAFKGSGDITSLAEADGYLEIPADTDTVEAGTEVEVTLF
jgi:molybdenum cofactor synthesis domain-containing protein